MDIRIQNLKRLVSRYPSQGDAALDMGIDPPALSRLLRGHDNLGKQRATSIETALGLRSGWLDEYRDDARHEWLSTFQAAITAGDTIEDAAIVADKMEVLLRTRFNK